MTITDAISKGISAVRKPGWPSGKKVEFSPYDGSGRVPQACRFWTGLPEGDPWVYVTIANVDDGADDWKDATKWDATVPPAVVAEAGEVASITPSLSRDEVAE